MADDNPYSSNLPAEPTIELDAELLQAAANALAATRENPPTVSGSLMKWPGTPLLVLTGVVGTATLWFASAEAGLTSH